MDEIKNYFEAIKQQCVAECDQKPLEKLAHEVFTRKEVTDLFLRQEREDEAYSFIVSLMSKYLDSSKKGIIYIPGSGVGGLSRRISSLFPKHHILQVDSSPAMNVTNRNHSFEYKNHQILQADVLDFPLKDGSLSAIIAYSIMRYVPSNERVRLINLWSSFLISTGVTIIGEGDVGEVVKPLNLVEYRREEHFEREANLFRCSLFYSLFRRYDNDEQFRIIVDKFSVQRNVSFVEVLSEITGLANTKVYAKVLQK